jgi:Leucine-rich repeat (LRR) protein
MSRNQIEEFDTEAGLHFLSSYPKLKALYVARKLPKRAVKSPVLSLLSLTKANFSCRLSPRLQYIDFSNNDVRLVDFIAMYTLIGVGLEELYISNTKSPCNHFTPFQTPKLRRIDISFNKCTKIPNNIFSYSNNISSINAANAQIH